MSSCPGNTITWPRLDFNISLVHVFRSQVLSSYSGLGALEMQMHNLIRVYTLVRETDLIYTKNYIIL